MSEVIKRAVVENSPSLNSNVDNIAGNAVGNAPSSEVTGGGNSSVVEAQPQTQVAKGEEYSAKQPYRRVRARRNRDFAEKEKLLGCYEVDRWLTGKNKATKTEFLNGVWEFTKFTGLNPKQLIDEAEEDRERSARYRGAPEDRLRKFHHYLLNDYVKKSGKNKGKTGLSEKRADVFFVAVKSFYNANGFELKIKTPKASIKKVNFKRIIRSKEVKSLLDWCTSLRDKAIILVLFQSLMGIGELCSLNYGDVARELKEEKIPLLLHIIRKKTKTEHYTFLGKDAADALKRYLRQREMRGEKLTHDSPLFLTEKGRRIGTRNIEIMFKKLAVPSGLVTESEMNAADMNPARPHAVRAGGMTILRLKGCNDTAVDFMAGHKLDEVQHAYWLTHPDELREMYSEYERYLSISAPDNPRNELWKELADIAGIDLGTLRREFTERQGKEPTESEIETLVKEKIRKALGSGKEQRLVVGEDVKYPNGGLEDPLKILKLRLAKGEITKKEYEELKKEMEA